jgi:hypothetical protein
MVFMFLNARHVEQVKGTVVSDQSEVWTVDFHDYFKEHPEYFMDRDVLKVNSNECLYDR